MQSRAEDEAVRLSVPIPLEVAFELIVFNVEAEATLLVRIENNFMFWVARVDSSRRQEEKSV